MRRLRNTGIYMIVVGLFIIVATILRWPDTASPWLVVSGGLGGILLGMGGLFFACYMQDRYYTVQLRARARRNQGPGATHL